MYGVMTAFWSVDYRKMTTNSAVKGIDYSRKKLGIEYAFWTPTPLEF